MTRTEPLGELARMSAALGADPGLVQGGGGNTSIKVGNELWVKASGEWLAHALEKPVFLPLPLDGVLEAVRAGRHDNLAGLAPPGCRLRPSIEASLHAVLPHPVIVHVHSVNAIAWAVRDQGPDLLRDRLNGLSWVWVPYRRPGRPLTSAVLELPDVHARPPDVLVLANHGLVVGASTCAGAASLLADVERRLAVPERPVLPPSLERLQSCDDCGWALPRHPEVHALGTDVITLEVVRRGALYPDHVVFLGEFAAILQEQEPLSHAVSRYESTWGARPTFVAVPGAGVLVSPRISSGAEQMLRCISRVGRRVSSPEDLIFLEAAAVYELTTWDAEHYRRTVDSRSPTGGAGHIG